MFNLNSKNFVGKTEYFDKLLSDVKTMVKGKQKESENKSKHFSHENIDPENIRSLSQPKVPTLIRPQLTNPKVFWSKFEDENISSSSKNIKNSHLEEKVVTNFFKPIRSEISPEMSNINIVNTREKKKKEFTGKVDKSIHESLRIQKIKRRPSLPFFWNEGFKQELTPAVEKVQAYDFSYYSSILKRMNQEKAQYYSSTKRNVIKKSFPLKSASDERIYEEKQNTFNRRQGGSKPERISVTEPSSPFPSDSFIEINRKEDSSDSESIGSDVVLEIKKSKSFVDQKEADGYFKTKSRTKMGALELSKTSQSSTSSCDSAYKTRSLRKQPKSKRKGESIKQSNFDWDSPKNQTYACQFKKYWSEIPEKDVPAYRKVSESGHRKKERFSNRDIRRDEDLQKVKENVFKHLIETLMQKNRSENTSEKQKELFSKSLPRNTRRWKNDKFEEECLEVLRSVLEQDSVAKKNQFKSFDRKYDISKKISPNGNVSLDPPQRRKTADMEFESRDTKAQWVLMRNETKKQKNDEISETLSKKKNSKGKLGTNLNEECVLSIEDEKLWIEICKAVEKVDVKGKIAKKCV